MSEPPRHPLPPFTAETAAAKVQAAEDAWNTRDPDRVAAAYTATTEWRNRAEFLRGRAAVADFLRRKWARETNYALKKYLWAFDGDRISVCFEYEYQEAATGQWFRAYGNENWEFDCLGYMAKRVASINEAPIAEHERRIAVPEGGGPPRRNAWLADRGTAAARGGAFPFGGGAAPAY